MNSELVYEELAGFSFQASRVFYWLGALFAIPASLLVVLYACGWFINDVDPKSAPGFGIEDQLREMGSKPLLHVLGGLLVWLSPLLMSAVFVGLALLFDHLREKAIDARIARAGAGDNSSAGT